MTPQFRTFSMVPHVSVNQDYLSPIWQQGLKGFPGVNSNKTCHMTNGNRRNLGYKLSSWNCGRGLMSRNESVSDKLLDIKIIHSR